MNTRSTLMVLTGLVMVTIFSGACTFKAADAASPSYAGTEFSATGDKEIDGALKLIDKMPDSPLAYGQLAALYIKKGRETGEFAFNVKAEASVDKALTIAPNDLIARKLKASLHLTFHRYSEALDAGKQLEKDLPNDPYVYGVLTDANFELGNYTQAIAAAQKMVDLKPNSFSYARVGRLRSLHGDHAGAVEMLALAARIADPLDKEGRSWFLVQLGDEYWKHGKYVEAEKAYDEALSIFPAYHLSIAAKGKVRASMGDFEGAAKYLADSQNRIPNAETVILLGDVHARRGDNENAKKQYDLVEVVEQKLGMKGDQKRLALFWADRGIKLDEAVAIAAAEHAARKDIFTADVLAWCLLKKGRAAEAKKIITEAMRLKTDDARTLYHAGMIEKELGNRKEAARLIEKSLKLNPSFDLIQAETAKEALKELA
ncbi:MAG: tetratricopeptide repeat protein [Blastocatellia bacterium]